MNTVAVIIWADSFVKERGSKGAPSPQPVTRSNFAMLGAGPSAVAHAVLKAQRD